MDPVVLVDKVDPVDKVDSVDVLLRSGSHCENRRSCLFVDVGFHGITPISINVFRLK